VSGWRVVLWLGWAIERKDKPCKSPGGTVLEECLVQGCKQEGEIWMILRV
jgi:hypothetical protein